MTATKGFVTEWECVRELLLMDAIDASFVDACERGDLSLSGFERYEPTKLLDIICCTKYAELSFDFLQTT